MNVCTMKATLAHTEPDRLKWVLARLLLKVGKIM